MRSDDNHVASGHNRIASPHYIFLREPDSVSTHTIQSRGDMVLSPRNEVLDSRDDVVLRADLLLRPRNEVPNRRNEVALRWDQIRARRDRPPQRRHQTRYVARKARIDPTRIPFSGLQRAGNRAQACPSKHPDGYIEALF